LEIEQNVHDYFFQNCSEQVSSSSVSGSESDPGFYTYDDGREADDEQSDWYQENGPTWGVPGNPWWERDGPQRQFRFRAAGAVGGAVEELEADDTDQDDAAGEEKKFQQLLKGSWQHLSDEAKDAYRLRMQKLRDRIVTQFTRKEKKSFWIRVTSFPFSPFF
jgi:hypothetical protein